MQKITDNPSEPCNIIDISLGLSRRQKHEKPPRISEMSIVDNFYHVNISTSTLSTFVNSKIVEIEITSNFRRKFLGWNSGVESQGQIPINFPMVILSEFQLIHLNLKSRNRNSQFSQLAQFVKFWFSQFRK